MSKLIQSKNDYEGKRDGMYTKSTKEKKRGSMLNITYLQSEET